MRKTTHAFLTMIVATITATSILIGGISGTQSVKASSHREAPLIALDPAADNTDVYAFVSPDRPNSVTLLANFIPFEDPSGGPNFFKFDDNVLYQIRVDNNGDGKVDLAIQFRFHTVVGNGNTFLYNTGPITSITSPNWNVKQFVDVTAQIRQGDPNNPTFTAVNLGTNLPTPPVNVGIRSTPNYETALAEPSISTIPTGFGDVKVFAGQRDEGFYSDLGAAFDLLGARPFNPAHAIPLPAANGVDTTAGFNVHTIAIQVPTQLLTSTGALPSGPTDPAAIVGIYSTASRPGTRVLNTNGTVTQTGSCMPGITPDNNCVQVSRLANPLVNELFDPMGTSPTTSENDKDLYNAQLPITDGTTRIDYIRGTAQRPVEPVNLINMLYPPVHKAPTSGRNDLVRVFLTGVPNATRPPVVVDPNDPTAGPGAVPADEMRLNVAVPAVAPGAPGYSRFGVIMGDMSGYPNGRRVNDDVLDITLRVGAGVLLPGNACDGGTTSCNQAPNNQLGDGVNENDRPFRTTFPYLASPWSGYENPYHGRTGSADTTTNNPNFATPRP